MQLPSRFIPFSVSASALFRVALASFLTSSFVASLARGALIASESFSVTSNGAGGTYDDDLALGSPSNLSVTVGNYGFTSGKAWSSGTAGALANLSGLSHPLVAGTTQSGGVRVGNLSGAISRSVYRQFSASPPAVDSYYFSGLVNLPTQASLNGQTWSMAGLTVPGVTPATDFNIANGIHYGLTKNNSNQIFLSVAAHDTVYPLFQITGDNATFQVVLKLDVNTSGNESLSAWYAPSSASELSIGLSSVNVGDIYSSPGNLGAFVFQTTNFSGDSNSGRTVLFDELRLGTAWTDVTTAAAPEPAQATLLCGAGSMALYALRRRRRF